MSGRHPRHKRKRRSRAEDLGELMLYCPPCQLDFGMPWETIFAIQECTHGYVGFDVSQDYLACPRCGEPGTTERAKPASSAPFG